MKIFQIPDGLNLELVFHPHRFQQSLQRDRTNEHEPKVEETRI